MSTWWAVAGSQSGLPVGRAIRTQCPELHRGSEVQQVDSVAALLAWLCLTPGQARGHRGTWGPAQASLCSEHTRHTPVCRTLGAGRLELAICGHFRGLCWETTRKLMSLHLGSLPCRPEGPTNTCSCPPACTCVHDTCAHAHTHSLTYRHAYAHMHRPSHSKGPRHGTGGRRAGGVDRAPPVCRHETVLTARRRVCREPHLGRHMRWNPGGQGWCRRA